jgi:hypothetical protein
MLNKIHNSGIMDFVITVCRWQKPYFSHMLSSYINPEFKVVAYNKLHILSVNLVDIIFAVVFWIQFEVCMWNEEL